MRPFLTPLMDGIGLAHSHRGGGESGGGYPLNYYAP